MTILSQTGQKLVQKWKPEHSIALIFPFWVVSAAEIEGETRRIFRTNDS